MDFRPPTSARNRAQAGFTLAEILIAATLTLMLSLGVISAYLFLGRNFTRLGNTQQQDVKGRRALFYFTQDVSSAKAFTSTSTSNLTMTVPAMVTLANCALTLGSATVTCSSTSGLITGGALSSLSTGVAGNATVASITNASTFVMSSAATASATGRTLSAEGTPTTVTYLYDSAGGTMQRTINGTTPLTLLTDIDSTATGPANGFVFYNSAGTALGATPNPNPGVKSVEFTFTTKVGTANLGTQSSYKIVSPRVVVRNKQFLP